MQYITCIDTRHAKSNLLHAAAHDNEPGQTLFRYTAGLTIQVYAVASTAYPGSLTFQAGTGSKVVEYFAVDAPGNASAIQSTGEL